MKTIKTLFAAVTVAVLISGCVQRDEKGRIVNYDDSFYYVMFDGHEYVYFAAGNRAGLTHSPRCDCLNQTQKEHP